MRVEGSRFDLRTALISDELICRVFCGRYERTERELLRRHLSEDSPVVELGGGIGLVSCIVNRRLRNPTQHVVVEANSRMLPVIERNRGLNGCRFELVHGAIAYVGTHAFLKTGESLLASRTETGAGGDIPIVRLHDLLDRRGFAGCTLICDIEGAEIDLVNNELETLQSRVGLIVVEEHPEYCAQVARSGMINLLINAGFESIESLRKVHVFRNIRRPH